MNIKYSLLTKQDIPFMKECVEEDGEYCADKLAQFIDYPNTYGFIAKQGEQVLGFAYCYKLKHPHIEDDVMFLYSIGICERYQNKGIGTGLIEFMKDYSFNKLGCGELFVLTDKGNSRACHVYEKCGGMHDCENGICYEIYEEHNKKRN